MTYFFTVQRKSDGKTDNIYEYSFKNGQFIGGDRAYGYDDIDKFIGIPAELIKEVMVKPAKPERIPFVKSKGEDQD